MAAAQVFKPLPPKPSINTLKSYNAMVDPYMPMTVSPTTSPCGTLIFTPSTPKLRHKRSQASTIRRFRSNSVSTVKTSNSTLMVLSPEYEDVTLEDLMTFLKYASNDTEIPHRKLLERSNTFTSVQSSAGSKVRSRSKTRRGRSSTRERKGTSNTETSVSTGSMARGDAIKIMAKLFDETGVFTTVEETVTKDGHDVVNDDLIPSLGDLASPFNINLDISLTDPEDAYESLPKRRRQSIPPSASSTSVLQFLFPCFFSQDDDEGDSEKYEHLQHISYPYTPTTHWTAPADARYIGGRLWSGRVLSIEEKSRRRVEPPEIDFEDMLLRDDTIRLTLTPRMVRGGVGISWADNWHYAVVDVVGGSGVEDGERLSPVDTLVENNHAVQTHSSDRGGGWGDDCDTFNV